MKKTVKLETRNEQSVKVIVGKEDMKDEDLAENIMLVYTTVVNSIPDENQNLRNVIVKLTMGKPFIIGKKPEEQPSLEKNVDEEKTEKVKEDKPIEEKSNEKKGKKETCKNKGRKT